MDTTTLLIWIFLIIGLVIMAIIAILGLYRRHKAFKIHIVKDYRNPNKSVSSFYAIKDSKTKSIDYYSNAFTPWATKHVPLYAIEAYADGNKNVRVIRSPTGKAGDDMDVPIGLALNSQAAALDYAKMVSDSVSNIMQLYDVCKEKDMRIGEILLWHKKRNDDGIKVKIVSASYDGIMVGYANTNYDSKVQGSQKIIYQLFDLENIKELEQIMKPEDKKKLEPLGYSDFFTDQWVMEKFGIRRVEDASVITIPQKTAIASLSSRANEFILDRSGFLEKHASVLIGLMILLFAGLTSIFVFYGANTFYTGITADVAGLVTTSGGHLAGSTTTIIQGGSSGVLNATAGIIGGK